MVYDVLRSSDPSDFTNGALCVESDDGTDNRAGDTEEPVSGSMFFYLTRAENGCPDGSGSLGAGRSGRSCNP